MSAILEQISQNLQRGKKKDVEELVRTAIEDGLGAGEILSGGLLAGMGIIGEKFKNNEVFLPEVLVAARAMNAGTAILKPLLVQSGVKPAGRVCIGTVQGDMHDIGKNIVRMMLEGRGFEVIDLGVDVPPEKFVEAARDQDCRIVCLSALLTTTMDKMGEVVQAFKAEGMRDRVKIMVGGAPVTQSFCDLVGADAYTEDAASCADMALRLVG